MGPISPHAAAHLDRARVRRSVTKRLTTYAFDDRATLTRDRSTDARSTIDTTAVHTRASRSPAAVASSAIPSPSHRHPPILVGLGKGFHRTKTSNGRSTRDAT